MVLEQFHPPSLVLACGVTSIIFLIGIFISKKRKRKPVIISSARKLQSIVEGAHAEIISLDSRLEFLHEELGKVREVRK